MAIKTNFITIDFELVLFNIYFLIIYKWQKSILIS